MATPLPHLRGGPGIRLWSSASSSSSSPPGHMKSHAPAGHATSVTAAPPQAARFHPRHALQAGGRGGVAMRRASSTGSHYSVSSKSRGLTQTSVAGVRVNFPRHSAAPRASAAGEAPPPHRWRGGGDGGELDERGAAAAAPLAPLGGPGEPSVANSWDGTEREAGLPLIPFPT